MSGKTRSAFVSYGYSRDIFNGKSLALAAKSELIGVASCYCLTNFARIQRWPLRKQRVSNLFSQYWVCLNEFDKQHQDMGVVLVGWCLEDYLDIVHQVDKGSEN